MKRQGVPAWVRSCSCLGCVTFSEPSMSHLPNGPHAVSLPVRLWQEPAVQCQQLWHTAPPPTATCCHPTPTWLLGALHHCEPKNCSSVSSHLSPCVFGQTTSPLCAPSAFSCMKSRKKTPYTASSGVVGVVLIGREHHGENTCRLQSERSLPGSYKGTEMLADS